MADPPEPLPPEPSCPEPRRVAPGRIELILGPMFSGKSTELKRRLQVALRGKHLCCLIRSRTDTRHKAESPEGVLQTHAGDVLKPDPRLAVVWATALREVRLPEGCTFVAIDEGQFFCDLDTFCRRLATFGGERGRTAPLTIVVAALNGTYDQTAFAPVARLLPHADRIVSFTSQCFLCGDDTCYTCKVGGGAAAAGHIEPGGAGKYEALCRRCRPPVPLGE